MTPRRRAWEHDEAANDLEGAHTMRMSLGERAKAPTNADCWVGRFVLGALLAGWVLVGSEPAYAQAMKYWGSATTAGNVELSTGPTVTVDLQRWRSRYTLVVDAVVRAANATTGALIATPTVNGIALDPSPSVATACNGHCFVSARWVLDLDEANVDHPGVFTSDGAAGLPLTILLQGLATDPEIGSLLLTAKLEKKR